MKKKNLKPKFKIGDIIICHGAEEPTPVRITSISDNEYKFEEDPDEGYVSFNRQHLWELVKSPKTISKDTILELMLEAWCSRPDGSDDLELSPAAKETMTKIFKKLINKKLG